MSHFSLLLSYITLNFSFSLFSFRSSLAKMIFLLLSSYLSLLTVTSGLRIMDVTFPGYAMLGQTVTLVCDYQQGEGEYVDSIKWYKDGGEFYRIVPSTPVAERDRVVIFSRPGVTLDRQKSGVSYSDQSGRREERGEIKREIGGGREKD